MGYATDQALSESRRVAGDSSFDVWSNYLFCPSLCRSCEYFYAEESNWPFHCKAPSTRAISHVSRNEKYRQYDGCALYKDNVTTITRPSSVDDIGVSVLIGIYKLMKSLIILLIGFSSKQVEEKINNNSRIPRVIRVILNVIQTIFSICYLVLLIAGWSMIIFDDSITNHQEKMSYIIVFSILTAIPIFLGIYKKIRKVKKYT